MLWYISHSIISYSITYLHIQCVHEKSHFKYTDVACDQFLNVNLKGMNGIKVIHFILITSGVFPISHWDRSTQPTVSVFVWNIQLCIPCQCLFSLLAYTDRRHQPKSVKKSGLMGKRETSSAWLSEPGSDCLLSFLCWAAMTGSSGHQMNFW